MRRALSRGRTAPGIGPTRGSRVGPILPLALLLAPSCGGPERAPPPAPATLSLRPVETVAEREPVKKVRELRPSAGNKRWTVEAKSYRYVEPQGTKEGSLALASETASTVRIRGPFGGQEFNLIAVQIEAHSMISVGVVVHGKRRDRAHLGRQLVRTLDEPTTILFEKPAPRLATARKKSAAIQELEIQIRGDTDRLSIRSVDLLHRSWEQWLPDPALPPELVELGDEGRRAIGLAQGTPLVCEFRASAGAELCFSQGVPYFLPPFGRGCALAVEVHDGERIVLRERFALAQPESEEDEAWQGSRMNLGELAGKDLRARFTLVGPGETPAICALSTPHLRRPGETAPTVLLVTSDTHRSDHLGCAADGAGVLTPVLDALASRGVLFEDCQSQANATRPSHAALMTATHPRDHGVLSNEARLAEAAPTLAEAFASSGYLTFASVCATPVLPAESGLEQGFERYSFPLEAQRTGAEAIADVLSWLPDADGVPLFVWLHVFDAHAPYQPPADLERLYYPAGADPRDEAHPALPEDLWIDWCEDVRDLDYLVASYKSEVTGLDRELERIFVHPRIRDGVIAFTADHGESLLAHELYFTHSGLYTDTLRIPLILVWPGAPAGSRIERPVQQMDVGRTVLDLTGLGEISFPGRNLTVDEESPAPRFAIGSNRWSASITHGGWHMIVHLRAREGRERGLVLQLTALHQTELYDLGADPGCVHDLVQEQFERARKMRSLLVRWLLDAPPSTWGEREETADQESMAELAALGYAAGDEEESSSVLWNADCVCPWCQKFE